VERGSLGASVDYSALDLLAMAHWKPEGLGPVARIAMGAGLFHAGGQLSVAGGGGLSFIDLARDENVLGLGADVTFMRKRRPGAHRARARDARRVRAAGDLDARHRAVVFHY